MKPPPCSAHAETRDNCSRCIEMEIAYRQGREDGAMDQRRERIATAALTGLLARDAHHAVPSPGQYAHEIDCVMVADPEVARIALGHADNLIAALDAKPEKRGA